MPVKKTPRILQAFPLIPIGSSNYCCYIVYYIATLMGSFPTASENYNPLQYITSGQLETMIMSVFVSGPPHLSYWNVLINLRLENLVLGNCLEAGATYTETVLRLASQRCYQLKTLSLCVYDETLHAYQSRCPAIWENVVPDALCHFPMLLELDLTGSLATDRVMEKLGKHCMELRILKAAGCSGITDVGIQYLCVPQQDNSENIIGGHCLHIKELHLNETAVTLRGIQLALVNLTELKVLSHDSLFQGLSSMHEANLMTERGTQLPEEDLSFPLLVSLFYGGDDYSNNLFSGALRRVDPCNISELVLTVNNQMTDSSLQAFALLKNLKHLSIIDSDNSQVTFNEGILPVLEAVGRVMVNLTIHNGPMIRVRAIARVCPKLKYLRLKNNRGYNNSTEKELNANFLYLEDVILLHRRPEVDCCKDLGAIFSSPKLEFIYITSCASLNDKILEAANLKHNFSHLKTLYLTDCNTVTHKGIDVLMNEKNPLEKCVLYECQSITTDDYKRWKELGKTRNWNFECPVIKTE